MDQSFWNILWDFIKQSRPKSKPNHNKIKWTRIGNKRKSESPGLPHYWASGLDGVVNEMLKYTSPKFQLAILKCFNLIHSVGYFPDIWNHGVITPIFRTRDKFDPNDYWGIWVNSNLGKVLCSIKNSRLINFITKYDVLGKCPIGFVS